MSLRVETNAMLYATQNLLATEVVHKGRVGEYVESGLQAICLCPHGVLRSRNLALALSYLEIPALHLENGLGYLDYMVTNGFHHEFIAQLELAPMVIILLDNMNLNIPFFARIDASFSRALRYPNEYSAFDEIRNLQYEYLSDDLRDLSYIDCLVGYSSNHKRR